MVAVNLKSVPVDEDFLAELTEAAYGVALRHGLKGPFINVELELWRELRAVLGRREEVGRWQR
jgi:hypothetical protein